MILTSRLRSVCEVVELHVEPERLTSKVWQNGWDSTTWWGQLPKPLYHKLYSFRRKLKTVRKINTLLLKMVNRQSLQARTTL